MTAKPLRRVGAVVVALALAACSSATTVNEAGPAGSSAGDVTADADGTLSFTAATLDGDQLDVATLAGEPVMLWFWAPWCTICRAEAPEVAATAAALEGRVTVLGVAGRGPEEDMRAFVDDTGTGRLDHLVDADGSLWGRFGVVAQPAYAFVAPDGSTEVFAGALGGEELRDRAEALAGR